MNKLSNEEIFAHFHTNIDSCKRFMGDISGLPIFVMNPQMGDLVSIYSRKDCEIVLRVVGREWSFFKEQVTLNVELHLQNGWTLTMFDEFMKSKGFPY